MTIVDNLMANIDGRTKSLEGPLDNLDCPNNTGAKTSGLSHENPHPNYSSTRASCEQYSIMRYELRSCTARPDIGKQPLCIYFGNLEAFSCSRVVYLRGELSEGLVHVRSGLPRRPRYSCLLVHIAESGCGLVRELHSRSALSAVSASCGRKLGRSNSGSNAPIRRLFSE